MTCASQVGSFSSDMQPEINHSVGAKATKLQK